MLLKLETLETMEKNQPYPSNHVIMYYHFNSSIVNAGQGGLDILTLL